MYPENQDGISTIGSGPFSSFSLSPDRRFISHSVNTRAGYRVIRTDGAGCIMNASAIDNPMAHSCKGGFRSGLWPLRQRLLSDGTNERKVYVSTDGTTASPAAIQECVLLDGGKTIEWRGITQVDDNPDTGVVPLSWDLDKSGNLIAAVSRFRRKC